MKGLTVKQYLSVSQKKSESDQGISVVVFFYKMLLRMRKWKFTLSIIYKAFICTAHCGIYSRSNSVPKELVRETPNKLKNLN